MVTRTYKQIKIKFVLVLFFNWAPRREGLLGEWSYSSTHLTLALDGGEWSASRPEQIKTRDKEF
jgi:hypothetical protein